MPLVDPLQWHRCNPGTTMRRSGWRAKTSRSSGGTSATSLYHPPLLSLSLSGAASGGSTRRYEAQRMGASLGRIWRSNQPRISQDSTRSTQGRTCNYADKSPNRVGIDSDETRDSGQRYPKKSHERSNSSNVQPQPPGQSSSPGQWEWERK